MSLKVTVVDEETGDTESRSVADGDYLVICVAPCYLHYVNQFPKSGTHQITIKGRTQP